MPTSPLGIGYMLDPQNGIAKGYGSARLGSLRLPVPPTATAPPYPSASLEPAIQQLITPGLVPDIARQSAEVSAGRGVPGSPAADSTAVRMTEQNYLQRLGLANQLLTGEASRTLPYQITPYQSTDIALKEQELQNQRDIASLRYGRAGTTGGGGGGQAGSTGGPWSTNTSLTLGQYPVVDAIHGTGPMAATNTFAPRAGGYGGGAGSGAGSFGTGLWGGAGVGGPLGGAGSDMTLDDIYEMLGFGQFGSLPGDTSSGSPDLGYLNE